MIRYIIIIMILVSGVSGQILLRKSADTASAAVAEKDTALNAGAGAAAAQSAPRPLPADISEKMNKVNDLVQKKTQNDGGTAPARSFFSVVFQTIGGLFFVLVLLLVGIYLLKKLQVNKFTRSSPFQDISILETSYVGNNQKISLVKVLDKVLVVGITPGSINTLMILDEEESRPYLETAEKSYNITTQGFNDSLNVLLSRFKKPAVFFKNPGDKKI